METAQLNKVAEITLLFWLMKIVATTLGETLGDYISMTLNLGYTIGIVITLAFFFVALLTQLAVKKYIPLVYWLVIIATTTLGTEISDYLDRTLHLGYALGSLLLLGDDYPISVVSEIQESRSFSNRRQTKRNLLLDSYFILQQFRHCLRRFSWRLLWHELLTRCVGNRQCDYYGSFSTLFQ